MDQINALATKARERISRETSQRPRSGVMRAEVVIPRVDALAWLRAQKSNPKFYWNDRASAYEFAGCGAAEQLVTEDYASPGALFARLGERLESCDAASRYFGGMRFASEGIREPVWQRFGGGRFVLPRFEVVSTDSASVLACHWLGLAGDAELLLAELESLEFHFDQTEQEDLVATGRFDLPDASRWCYEVDSTLSRLSRGDLQKLVLARKSVFQFTRSLDPLACLQALSGRADPCYRFCFILDSELSFLGVSPERLYRRQGRRILTEAIAGTRVRSAEPLEDACLARELMESEKEQREHAYVVRGVRETVGPLCEMLRPSGDVSVLKLEECQHLMSLFEGYLRASVGDIDLLSALQPTPAVGGYPARIAVRELARIEPFDRGWYAGPIGWVGKAGAEFAVAIRSGLAEGSKLSVYAGAGIVQGSAADKEWQELDNKIRHFTRVLNLS